MKWWFNRIINFMIFIRIIIALVDLAQHHYPSFHLPTGLFNVCDKVMISLDILLEFREYFRKGHPIGNVIMSKLSVLRMKCREVSWNNINGPF